jgi:ribosomal protein L31
MLSLAACTGDTPVSPAPIDFGPSFSATAPPESVYVRLCKVSVDDGTFGQQFDFETTATAGDLLLPQTSLIAEYSYTLDIEADCKTVWVGHDRSVDTETLVTLTELDKPGFEIETIRVWDLDDTFQDVAPIEGSVTLVPGHGKVVVFRNRKLPPPPTGGEGCTPGYWRQPHHYDSWVGYAPSDIFSDVFGVGPDLALGDAVELGKGGESALVRHAVAALLNAASPDVSYAMTEAEIIDLVQQAFDSGDFEAAKDLLDELNNSGCGLN